MSKEEQIHATTWNNISHLESWVDDTVHVIDPALITSSEDELKVWGYVMTQYNLKPGLRKFGSRGEKAAINKLTQLHIIDTWTEMDASRLSREERLKALSSLLFLKEKQTGAIKGRACINGAHQREYISKEEAASPTVSMESTFITVATAANEKRKVRCYDFPSAFVNMDMDEDVLMVLKGKLADMMVQIVTQVYRKYVTVDRKGTPILYVKLQKALFGLMRASLLFYRKLRKELKGYGLTINPYNPCIANVTTRRGKQLTVVWHVDDLMALCEVDFKLTRFSCYLAKIYGPKLTMRTGQKHDYLGVDMEFKDYRTFDVSMATYLENVISEFLEMIGGKAETPVGDHLFQIREGKVAKPLEEESSLAFHHTVAQLLFMATRARRDIQTALAFLTIQVKTPDEDNGGKLKRMLKYLNVAKYLKLNLTVDDMGLLKWYVDGSHNVHWDCKGHGGAMFTMGKGATSSYSRKVKLNTRSLTETELVTADMFMPEMLWSLYFIQAQGYGAKCVGLYQHNISAQLLMKNGRFSSGKKTKHIKENIKDRVDDGDMWVIDCSTGEMWADALTKPLQGMAFKKMRAQLMNCAIEYKESKIRKTSSASGSLTGRVSRTFPFQAPQECVGQNRSSGQLGVPIGQSRSNRQLRVS
jgi:hypothetical protein